MTLPRRAPIDATPARVLVTAAALALLTGVAEAGLHGIRRYGMDRLVWLGPDFPWLTPAGYVLLFAPPALLLAAGALRWPGLAERAATWLFVFLGAFSLSWHLRGIHLLALALVAAGVATQVTRLAGRRPEVWARLGRRAALGLGATMLLFFVLSTGGRRVGEGLRLAGLPRAEPRAPHVVLIILDTVRARQLDLYGYSRPTAPRLRTFAAGAVVFDRAMSPSPSSLPGHAALLTGRLPHEIRADWRRSLEGDVLTLGEVLQERGYATGAFSGNLFYFTRESGLARGFIHFSGYGVSAGQAVRSTALGQFLIQTVAAIRSGGGALAPVGWVTEGKPADRVLAEVESWVSDAPDRPLFLTVNLLDAHRPYRPPEPFRSRFVRGCPRTFTVQRCVAQTRVDLYDGAIAHVDAALERLLAMLDREGILEHAVVAVTSDHGEHLGERGLVGHGNSLYWPALHVPLVVRAPDAPMGARVAAPVSLVDLPVTLAILATGAGGGLPGRSLARFWEPGGDALPFDTLLASARGSINRPASEPLSRGDMYAALAWPLHYVRNGDGSEELYHLERDSLEERDLAGGPLGALLLEPLRSFVEHRRAGAATPD